MSNASVLVAGIGNIFQGDDAFGVSVIGKLAGLDLPRHVRLMDIGIRAIDLGFALLDEHELTILVDATARGGTPGTLYTLEISPGDIPDASDEALVNSHGLDPVRVLALAKSMGAQLKNVLLIGCEPLALDHDNTGHIGLSAPVEAAVDSAVATIEHLIQKFTRKKEEVCSHELV